MISTSAWAGFSTWFDRSATSATSSISYFHDIDLADQETGIRLSDWSLGYDRYTVLTTDSFTGDSVTQQTTTLSGGLGFALSPQTRWGWSIDSAQTPEEKLSTFGVSTDLRHRFATRTTLGGRVGFATTTQTIPRSRLLANTSADNRIQQRLVGASVSQGLWNWLRLSVSGTVYGYNRDLTEFMSSINSNFLRSLALGGLANSVSSFQRSDASLGALFFILETWGLDLKSTFSTLALDNSLSVSHKVFITKEFPGYGTVGVGQKQTLYGDTTTNFTLFSLDIELN